MEYPVKTSAFDEIHNWGGSEVLLLIPPPKKKPISHPELLNIPWGIKSLGNFCLL